MANAEDLNRLTSCSLVLLGHIFLSLGNSQVRGGGEGYDGGGGGGMLITPPTAMLVASPGTGNVVTFHCLPTVQLFVI